MLGLEPHVFTGGDRAPIVFVDNVDAYEMVRTALQRFIRKGGTAVFLEQEPRAVWHFENGDVSVKGMRGKEFVSRKTGHSLVASFQPFDFSNWYDRGKDYIEYVAASYLEGSKLIPILLTAEAARPGDPDPKRKTMPVVGELRLGKGSLIVTQLEATDRVEYEPVAAAYYQSMVDRAVR